MLAKTASRWISQIMTRLRQSGCDLESAILKLSEVASGDAEKPKVFLPPVDRSPSTVQVPRLIGVQMHRVVMIFFAVAARRC